MKAPIQELKVCTLLAKIVFLAVPFNSFFIVFMWFSKYAKLVFFFFENHEKTMKEITKKQFLPKVYKLSTERRLSLLLGVTCKSF